MHPPLHARHARPRERRLKTMARALWKGAIAFGLVQHPGRALPGARIASRSSSRCSTSATSRRSATSATARRPARKSRGTTSSRATSTRRTSTSCCPTRTSGAPTSRRRRRSTSSAFVAGRRDPARVLRDAVLPRAGRARPEGLRAAARDAARDQAHRRSRRSCIRTTQHLAAVIGERQGADAQHAALPGRAARRERPRPAGGRAEGRRRHAEGGRARQAARRRHDRALEAGASSRTPITTT